ncbi:unnamed protein product [Scytosiphon promiscuus]
MSGVSALAPPPGHGDADGSRSHTSTRNSGAVRNSSGRGSTGTMQLLDRLGYGLVSLSSSTDVAGSEPANASSSTTGHSQGAFTPNYIRHTKQRHEDEEPCPQQAGHETLSSDGAGLFTAAAGGGGGVALPGDTDAPPNPGGVSGGKGRGLPVSPDAATVFRGVRVLLEQQITGEQPGSDQVALECLSVLKESVSWLSRIGEAAAKGHHQSRANTPPGTPTPQETTTATAPPASAGSPPLPQLHGPGHDVHAARACIASILPSVIDCCSRESLRDSVEGVLAECAMAREQLPDVRSILIDQLVYHGMEHDDDSIRLWSTQTPSRLLDRGLLLENRDYGSLLKGLVGRVRDINDGVVDAAVNELGRMYRTGPETFRAAEACLDPVHRQLVQHHSERIHSQSGSSTANGGMQDKELEMRERCAGPDIPRSNIAREHVGGGAGVSAGAAAVADGLDETAALAAAQKGNDPFSSPFPPCASGLDEDNEGVDVNDGEEGDQEKDDTGEDERPRFEAIADGVTVVARLTSRDSGEPEQQGGSVRAAGASRKASTHPHHYLGQSRRDGHQLTLQHEANPSFTSKPVLAGPTATEVPAMLGGEGGVGGCALTTPVAVRTRHKLGDVEPLTFVREGKSGSETAGIRGGGTARVGVGFERPSLRASAGKGTAAGKPSSQQPNHGTGVLPFANAEHLRDENEAFSLLASPKERQLLSASAEMAQAKVAKATHITTTEGKCPSTSSRQETSTACKKSTTAATVAAANAMPHTGNSDGKNIGSPPMLHSPTAVSVERDRKRGAAVVDPSSSPGAPGDRRQERIKAMETAKRLVSDVVARKGGMRALAQGVAPASASADIITEEMGELLEVALRLTDDSDFKIALLALQLVHSLVLLVGEKMRPPHLARVFQALAARLGDHKVAARHHAMAALSALVRVVGLPQTAPYLTRHGLRSAAWRAREGALKLIIVGVLSPRRRSQRSPQTLTSSVSRDAAAVSSLPATGEGPAEVSARDERMLSGSVWQEGGMTPAMEKSQLVREVGSLLSDDRPEVRHASIEALALAADVWEKNETEFFQMLISAELLSEERRRLEARLRDPPMSLSRLGPDNTVVLGNGVTIWRSSTEHGTGAQRPAGTASAGSDRKVCSLVLDHRPSDLRRILDRSSPGVGTSTLRCWRSNEAGEREEVTPWERRQVVNGSERQGGGPGRSRHGKKSESQVAIGGGRVAGDDRTRDAGKGDRTGSGRHAEQSSPIQAIGQGRRERGAEKGSVLASSPYGEGGSGGSDARISGGVPRRPVPSPDLGSGGVDGRVGGDGRREERDRKGPADGYIPSWVTRGGDNKHSAKATDLGSHHDLHARRQIERLGHRQRQQSQASSSSRVDNGEDLGSSGESAGGSYSLAGGVRRSSERDTFEEMQHQKQRQRERRWRGDSEGERRRGTCEGQGKDLCQGPRETGKPWAPRDGEEQEDEPGGGSGDYGQSERNQRKGYAPGVGIEAGSSVDDGEGHRGTNWGKIAGRNDGKKIIERGAGSGERCSLVPDPDLLSVLKRGGSRNARASRRAVSATAGGEGCGDNALPRPRGGAPAEPTTPVPVGRYDHLGRRSQMETALQQPLPLSLAKGKRAGDNAENQGSLGMGRPVETFVTEVGVDSRDDKRSNGSGSGERRLRPSLPPQPRPKNGFMFISQAGVSSATKRRMERREAMEREVQSTRSPAFGSLCALTRKGKHALGERKRRRGDVAGGGGGGGEAVGKEKPGRRSSVAAPHPRGAGAVIGPPSPSSLALAKPDSFDYLTAEDIRPSPNPSQELQRAMASLPRDDWPEIFHTLNSVRRLATHHGALLGSQAHLHALVRDVLGQAENLRSQVAKNALLTLADLWRGLGDVLDPELPMVCPLLVKKLADKVEFLADAARECVEEVVETATEARSLSAFLACGTHRSPAVRAKSALATLLCVRRRCFSGNLNTNSTTNSYRAGRAAATVSASSALRSKDFGGERGGGDGTELATPGLIVYVGAVPFLCPGRKPRNAAPRQGNSRRAP